MPLMTSATQHHRVWCKKKDFLPGVESATRPWLVLDLNVSVKICQAFVVPYEIKMRVWSRRFCLGVSPRCFDLLSDLIRCCHGGFSLRRKWGQGGWGWQKWGMVSSMLFKRIILSDSLGIAEGLIFIFQFHSTAFILLNETGTTENQPLQTFFSWCLTTKRSQTWGY